MARTNYIFVDYENRPKCDWTRIAGKPVKVTLVTGPSNKTMPISTIQDLLKCTGQVSIVQSQKAGRNAADNVLSSLVTEQFLTDPKGYYHIVSGDRGFESLIDHLRGKGGLASSRKSLSDIPVLMNSGERVAAVSSFLKAHPQNRPAKKKALEAQIQVLFGKGLKPEELAETISTLTESKALVISSDGRITY